jgi:hypothetical protein
MKLNNDDSPVQKYLVGLAFKWLHKAAKRSTNKIDDKAVIVLEKVYQTGILTSHR